MKIVLAITTLVTFLLIMATPLSWQGCIPGACLENNELCSNSAPCVNEVAANHINERMAILNSTMPVEVFGLFLASFLLLFERFLSFSLLTLILARKLIKIMKKCCHWIARQNNYLLSLFSTGLEHPQTYLLAA